VETRLIKISVPGTAFFVEHEVPDGSDEGTIISRFICEADKNMMVQVKNPWVLIDKQVLICPACAGEISEAALNAAPICPNCNSIVVDPQTGQPIELGGRKLSVKNTRAAVSLTHIAEAADVLYVSLRSATVLLINKDSNIEKMIQKAKVDLEQEKAAEAQAKSGIVVANNLQAIDQMAVVAKKTEEHLKRGKFVPKLVP